MSTPSWVRRFSDADGTLTAPDSSSTPASLYSGSRSNLSGSRSNLYHSRSKENLAPESRQYRHLASSYDNLSSTSGRARSDVSGRYGNGFQTSRQGVANSGYVSDAGSSKYRSGNESGGDEIEMTPRFTTLQGRKKQQKYQQRTNNRTVDRLPKHVRDGLASRTKREESWSYVDSGGYSEASASCSVNISLFPFDTQVCTINIATWGYTSSEINLVGSFVKADYPFFRDSSVWKLLDLSLETGNQDDFAFITISLQFKRHWQYFMVNILLAPVLLGFLSPCVFLLPASSGERISFAITCFLAFGLFSSLLADNIPRSSAPVARLCYALMNMTIQSFAVVFCTILSLRMYVARDDSKVPSCIQTFIKTCRQKSRWEEAVSPTDIPIAAPSAHPYDGEKHRASLGIIKITNNYVTVNKNHDGKGPTCNDEGADCVDMELDKNPVLSEESRVTWRDIAHIMDYVFFITFTGAMLVNLLISLYSLLL